MRQARSFLTASNICHQLDPNFKKRKSDKMATTQREKPQNHNQIASRGPNWSEGERKYPLRELKDDSYASRFNLNRKHIFYAIRDELPPPFTIPTPQNRRNMDLWCEYHKEHGHKLPNCRELKRILDQFADEGKLNRFLYRGSSGRWYNSDNWEYRKV